MQYRTKTESKEKHCHIIHCMIRNVSFFFSRSHSLSPDGKIHKITTKKGKVKLTQAKEYQIVVPTDRQHGT